MPGSIDARPFRLSAPSAWDRAVEDRARIEAVLRDTLRAEGVDAAVIPSEDGIYPPWVRVQAWMGDKAGGRQQTYRSLVEIAIDAKPFHRAPVVRTVKLTNGPRKLELAERPNLTDADIAAWARHALGRAPRPASYRPWGDALLGLAAMVHLARAPHINRLEKRFRPQWITAESVLLLLAIVCGTVAVGAMSTYEYAGGGVALATFAAIFFALMLVVPRFRVVAIHAPPQPSATVPRRLIEVDEWHAVATGLAEHADNFARYVGRAIESAARGSDIGMAYTVETVHHLTPNGYEARPRHVLRRGQAEVHLDIYGFGDDLFVGWNANLNWLQWGETLPVSKRKAGLVVTHHVALAPGFYTPTQLDLIDLNCLTELVHRGVKKELEGLLKAAAIDQQVDFEITRGDRGRALDRKRHGTSAEERGEGRWSDIMRAYAPWSRGADTQSMRASAITPLRPASGKGGIRAALTVVAIWAAALVSLTVIGQSPYRSTASQAMAAGVAGAIAAGLALAVGASIISKLSIVRCCAIFVGAIVLSLSLSALWSMTFDWWMYRYYIAPELAYMIVPAGSAVAFVLSLLVPLMVVLPPYRRVSRVLVCLVIAVAVVPLAYVLRQEMDFGREAYSILFKARTALLMALIGSWLPRR